MSRRRRLTRKQQALVSDRRAQSMARRLVRLFASYYEGIDRDDLHALAQEALVLAAPLYDPSRGASFAAFAARRVHGHLLRALSRELIHLTTNGHGATLRADVPLPDDIEVDAAARRWATRHWQLARGLHYVQHHLLSHSDSGEEKLHCKRLLSAINEARQQLPVDLAHVVQQHYFEDVPLRGLRGYLRRGASATSRVHQAALSQLRHALVQQGFDEFADTTL